jgi:hypothetical protein
MSHRPRELLLVMLGAAIVVTATALSPVVGNAVSGSYYNRASTPIGVGSVHLTAGYADEAGTALRAFVPTGSTSDRCLMTINEISDPSAGVTLQCSPRTFDERDGIELLIWLPTQVTTGFQMDVNIYQEFATGYGAPEPCDHDGC